MEVGDEGRVERGGEGGEERRGEGRGGMTMIGRNGEEWLFDLNCEGLDSLIACNHVFHISTANSSN